MSLPQFKLLRPRSLDEAIGLLSQHGANVRLLAGGTDLIPSMRQKLFEPDYVMDLRRIAAMRGIKPLADGGVELGALATLREIERSEFLRQHYPVLTEAAATVASPVLRNMGTLGGNICLDTRCLWYNQSLTGAKVAASASRKMAISATSRPEERNAGQPSPATHLPLCSVWMPTSRLSVPREPVAFHWRSSIAASVTTTASCNRTNLSPAYSCRQRPRTIAACIESCGFEDRSIIPWPESPL